MLGNSLKNPLAELYHVELLTVQWLQNVLTPVEPALLLLSEHFKPAKLMDVYVPLVGAFNHQLLVRLVGALGVINVISSLVKWSMPANRPYWWIREYNESSVLQQYHGTCETTAAFPSSHCLSFTTFFYLVVLFLLPPCWRRLKLSTRHLSAICRALVILSATCMSLSRIYLAAQFPHQCFASCFGAIAALHAFDRYSDNLYTLSRFRAVLIVFCGSIFPVVIYLGMLRLDLDPHWSVRMAFKWCMDPAQMRHEESSIFVLGRDFGYLMGVVLSAPLYKRYENKTVIVKRLPILFVLEMLNHYARLETPKSYGRVAFVGYEFLRNAMHSFTLLTILPKTTT
ncbi:PREDICTED: glucose-6-phosphatase 2-like [Rhagoletis zephyria]|uniref:glucose-6-phosphatase 2-like n=1 Tax=Rhagoletis zephyria TaxID=28612 RepID=UPI00081168CB|nr:PREDICTED: glucose-6-phosphatase 2-like [Rhagoletis zephyria]XP_036320153.1 glucose-6-phosphatase 2 [Rhagoletis pomonella]